MKYLIVILWCSIFSMPALATNIDCSEAYGGKNAICQVVSCDAKYVSFLGTWSGPFFTYVRELSTSEKSVYRPFNNVVTYSKKDCLKNLSNGDTFIIGRRTDTYPAFQNLPAKIVKGLLITGKKMNDSPFLRTVDEDGVNNYVLVYQNKVANTSIWSLTIPASANNPEMRFTTIDAQDFSVQDMHKRNVTVTMSVGSQAAPYWEGVVSAGFHSLKAR